MQAEIEPPVVELLRGADPSERAESIRELSSKRVASNSDEVKQETRTISEGAAVQNADKTLGGADSARTGLLEARLASLENEHAKSARKTSHELARLEAIVNSLNHEMRSLGEAADSERDKLVNLDDELDVLRSQLSLLKEAKATSGDELKRILQLVKGSGLTRTGLRLVGSEMQTVRFIPAADDCFDLCKKQLNCAAATFSTTWFDNCYLFERGAYAKVTDSANPDWVSFIKDLYLSDE